MQGRAEIMLRERQESSRSGASFQSARVGPYWICLLRLMRPLGKHKGHFSDRLGCWKGEKFDPFLSDFRWCVSIKTSVRTQHARKISSKPGWPEWAVSIRSTYANLSTKVRTSSVSSKIYRTCTLFMSHTIQIQIIVQG